MENDTNSQQPNQLPDEWVEPQRWDEESESTPGPETETPGLKASKEKRNKRRTTELLETTDRYLYRRAFSEVRLMDAIGYNWKEGTNYHLITAGDVDQISYLKIALRQQTLEHCLFSTWILAGEDVLQFEEWLQEGKIKKLDAYLGEIFPTQYRYEYQKLKQVFEKYKCGRIAVFRNHSKVIAGTGDKFTFGLQSSGNMNTNPRTENACLTIGEEIYHFYKDYFDKIVSFE